MGEILRFRNIRIFIYPKDHGPPHVHAVGPEAEAKFRIDDLECFFSRGFTAKDRKEIQRILKKYQPLLKVKWDENR